MTHPSRARRLVPAALLSLGTAALLGAPARAAAPATTPGPVPTVAEAVTSALASAAPYTRVDDSSATDCMSSLPAPLAYRADRIVLRARLGTNDARTKVNSALAQVASPGAAGAVEAITLPGTSGDSTPLLSVVIDRAEGRAKIVKLARRLRQLSIPASPDYVLSPSGPVGMWPNGYPKATTVVEPPRAPALGAGVEVWLYDTGLPNPTTGAWAPNLSRLGVDDVEHLDVVRPARDVVDIYSGGHSLAIGDVLGTVAPSAVVKAIRITEADGVATDVSAARRMAQTLRAATTWPQVIVNAFGSPACEYGPTGSRIDMPPLGLQAVAEAVGKRGGSLIVASAGNRSSSRPFYPAAFDPPGSADAVLSVGALQTASSASGDAWSSASRSAPTADFSNYGPWVEAWAPGVDLATRHVIGLRFEPGPTLSGRALVSGTSFAAPYVAGLVAEQIARSGAGPRDAWAAVAAAGRTCSAGVGGGVAVALTSMSAEATAQAPATAPTEC